MVEIYSITTSDTKLQISALVDRNCEYIMPSLQKIFDNNTDILIAEGDDLNEIYVELLEAVENEIYLNLEFVNNYNFDYDLYSYHDQYIRFNNLEEVQELLNVFNRAKELKFF